MSKIEDHVRTLYADALDASGAGGQYVRDGHGNLWIDPALVVMAALAEEVAYWRREEAARAWKLALTARVWKDTDARGAVALHHLKAEHMIPLLNAWDAAERKEWHSLCESCQQPLLNGQQVLYWSKDALTMHFDCVDVDGPGGNAGDPEHPDFCSHAYDDAFAEGRIEQMIQMLRDECAEIGGENDNG